MNGLPVNTASGMNVMEMCKQLPDKKMTETITAMARGTIVYGVALRMPMTVQLVPCCWHQKVLAGPTDSYDNSEVFTNSRYMEMGPHLEHLRVSEAGTQQLFLLRAVVLRGPSKVQVPGAAAHRLVVNKLAFLVKVFNSTKEVGFMPGLRLGVVYADALHADKCTVAPYVEVCSLQRPQSCGANIVLAQPGAPAPPKGLAPPKLSQMKQTFANARPEGEIMAQASVSPRLGASFAGPRMSISPHPVDSLAPGHDAAASNKHELVTWVEDRRRHPGPAPKRTKNGSVGDMLPQFPSSTCESLMPPSVMRGIRQMSREEFTLQHVLGGKPAEPLTELVGHEMRQHRAEVWHALSAFWSPLAVQHLAGVFALLLDGYGHGKMNLLVKTQHRGCCGRWDMMAVWAAKYLNMFPPKFVSAPHRQK